MKYAVDSKHRNFFQKNQLVELENLVTDDQISKIKSALCEVMSARLKISADQLKRQPSEKIFMNGRDVWRSHSVLKKIACQQGLAEIASELVEQKPISLGFDQLIIAPSSSINEVFENHAYTAMIKTNDSLGELCSLQGVLCGLMIALTDAPEKVDAGLDSEAEVLNVFPAKAGNGICFSPTALINFPELESRKGQWFLLITYTHPTTVYISQKQDPHTHHLKSLGYQYHDKLSIKYHPVVYR